MVVRRKSEAHPICFFPGSRPAEHAPLCLACRRKKRNGRCRQDVCERKKLASHGKTCSAKRVQRRTESRRRPVVSHARNPALLSLPTSARARWLPVLGMGHAFEHTVHSTLTQGVMGASLRSYTGVFSKWLHNVLVPERLRGLTRNQLGSACAGSSPAEHDVFEKKKPCVH